MITYFSTKLRTVTTVIALVFFFTGTVAQVKNEKQSEEKSKEEKAKNKKSSGDKTKTRRKRKRTTRNTDWTSYVRCKCS